jgi:hypothetical protein
MKRLDVWCVVCGAAVLAAGFSMARAGDAASEEWAKLLEGPVGEKAGEKSGGGGSGGGDQKSTPGFAKPGDSPWDAPKKAEVAGKGEGLAGMAAVLAKKQPLQMTLAQVGSTYQVKTYFKDTVFFEGIGLLEKDLLITAGVRNNNPELVIFQVGLEEGGKPGEVDGGRPMPGSLKRIRGVAMPKPGEKAEVFEVVSKVLNADGKLVGSVPVAAAGVNELESGVYNLSSLNSTGAGYKGTLTVENIAKVWRLHWSIGRNETFDGVGLMEGDLFCVACTVQGRACVVVYKMKKDGTADGRRAVTPGKMLDERVKFALISKLPGKGEVGGGERGAGERGAGPMTGAEAGLGPSAKPEGKTGGQSEGGEKDKKGAGTTGGGGLE